MHNYPPLIFLPPPSLRPALPSFFPPDREDYPQASKSSHIDRFLLLSLDRGLNTSWTMLVLTDTNVSCIGNSVELWTVITNNTFTLFWLQNMETLTSLQYLYPILYATSDHKIMHNCTANMHFSYRVFVATVFAGERKVHVQCVCVHVFICVLACVH